MLPVSLLDIEADAVLQLAKIDRAQIEWLGVQLAQVYLPEDVGEVDLGEHVLDCVGRFYLAHVRGAIAGTCQPCFETEFSGSGTPAGRAESTCRRRA